MPWRSDIPVLSDAVHGFEGEISLTTQPFQFGKVRDYGGFTDGDRAVELARRFGTTDILLLGFDFGNPKKKKKARFQFRSSSESFFGRII